MTAMPIYLQVIFSVASLVVAFSAVFVARAQWNLAKQKLQFDLFDRRLGIKIAIFDLGSSLVMTGQITSEAWRNFIDHAYNCRFLFPTAGAQWIQEVYDKGWQYMVLNGEINRAKESPQRDKNEVIELLKKLDPFAGFIVKLGNEVDATLDGYLKIETV